MLFNSYEFMIFFPIVVIIFLIIPKSLRSIWLLTASYYFYMSWNPRYAVLIVASTLITYISGILLERSGSKVRRKLIVALSFVCNLTILFVFKYANFMMDTLAVLLGTIGIGFTQSRLDFLLPVGISFYTFQALGYTIDVYRGDIKAEKNFIDYALFVSFFPQLVAGPIERSGNLLNQIRNIKSINILNRDRIRSGLLLMSWGLFQKLVIADRASILVDHIYNNYEGYGTAELSIATAVFAFQIYGDFAGYTNIARGAASVMGFELMENFRQPYLAVSISDYWRRWHISMTSWFRDYLYFPLGGSRKGILRKYLNIIIVFFASGLWHGASWHYVAWGLVNSIYQIIEDLAARIRKKFKVRDAGSNIILRIVRTCIAFMFICSTLVFFASKSVPMACDIFRRIFTLPLLITGDYGLDKADLIVLAASVLILIAADIIHECGYRVTSFISRCNMGVRIIFYSGIIWTIVLFGIYGTGYDTGQFIYFQF